MLLLAVLLALMPVVEGASYDNTIGLFFDPENLVYCADSITPYTPVTVYVALVQPTFAELYGWEAAVGLAGYGLPILEKQVLLGGVDTGSGAEFQVSFAEPVATSSITVLGSFRTFVLELETCLYLTGISQPSLADPNPIVWPAPDAPTSLETTNLMGYGVEAAIGRCTRIPEDTSPPVCAEAVGERTLSWGALKARYR